MPIRQQLESTIYCTSNHLPQTVAPTSHPTSPLSLPLSGKELHTAPPTNCYKKELQQPHSTIISNGYQHHLMPLDIHPQPPNTTTTPEDNSTQSTFYAPYHQNAIICNIISLYIMSTTLSNIFYYGDLL